MEVRKVSSISELVEVVNNLRSTSNTVLVEGGATNASLLTTGTLDVERIEDIPQSKVINLVEDLAGKQPLLEPGINIKTINNISPLGPGNINIPTGTGDVTLNGIQTLTNKTIS